LDNNNITIVAESPTVMYIDMAYTIKNVRERALDQELSSRDCGGFFKHVWGVHPIADIPEKRTLTYEGFKVSEVQFSDNQTLIEGVSAYYGFLKKIYPINFLLSQIRFISFLVALVKKKDISIIVSTDPHFSGLIGLFCKLFTNAKLVIWVVANNDDIFKATGLIANPRLFRKRWVEKIIEQIVFRNSDLVAGGNQDNLEFALNNGAKKNKSTVFPIGKLIHKQHQLDPKLRNIDDLFKTSKAKYHFIYVGRLTEIKFPDDVINAFAYICRKEPDCALIIAGDGPMRKELEAIAIKLQIQAPIYFTGNINQVKLANILGSCFAALSPLTGRSLVEASLAALPIVAYDRDWQLDFVTKSGNGLVVPFRDWKKMAEAALHLIDCPEDTKRYSEASRCIGLTFCDTEKIYLHEKIEFNRLLKKR
jgi:glycosyltransferase involved in cell wall biosynthesis